jgi:hypothetical protein
MTTAPETIHTTPAARTAASLRANPPVLTQLTSWWRPATTAHKIAATRLRRAYAIHLLAGLAFFFGFLLLAQIDAWNRGSSYNVFTDILGEFDRHWQNATLITALTVLSVELSFLLLALIVLPWGAGDEPLRSSWAHALRFTWLHTTHALPLLLVIGVAFLWIEDTRHAYFAGNRRPMPDIAYRTPPTLPPNATPGSKTWQDYQDALKEYQQGMQDYSRNWQRTYQQWRRSQPFVVRHAEDLVCWLCIAGSVWILWALFRATGARRAVPPIQRPPMCEFCGYNLTGTAIDGRCPECGVPAIDSLGPDVRPGTGWERGGGLIAWCRCIVDAFIHPARLGRFIQVTTQPRRHRWCCWPLLLSICAVGAGAPLLMYRLTEHRNPMEYEPEVVTIVSPILGATSAAGFLMILMLVAAVVGMIQTWQNKRNLLPAAAQMASYLILPLVFWAIFTAAWISLIVFGVTEHWFREWAQARFIDEGFLAFVLILLPQPLWLLSLFIPLWKGTSAARHANR